LEQAQAFTQSQEDYALDLQRTSDDRFYAAMGDSNQIFSDLNAASVVGDPDTYEAYNAWRAPQREAYEAVFGPISDTTLGQVGQIGASVAGAMGHSLFDGVTDTLAMGIDYGLPGAGLANYALTSLTGTTPGTAL